MADKEKLTEKWVSDEQYWEPEAKLNTVIPGSQNDKFSPKNGTKDKVLAGWTNPLASGQS